MHLRPLFKEIANRLKTDYNSIVYLTFVEIKNSLIDGRIDSTKVAERKKAFGLIMHEGEITIYSGDEAAQLEDVGKLENVSEVTGTPACLGKVRGRVKLVLRNTEFHKVEQGDILVTKNTTPEFMVVLEKCAGIVTDVGGVTSHAAIVARELNKPCVIGTGKATKVFKDGDQVEVDAFNGVVKII